MTLLPGCRFAVAPHFHLPGDWSSRLLIGAGIAEADGGFIPRSSWRPPTAAELSVLVEPPPLANLEDVGCLFLLPQHLRAEWWQWLERTHESNKAGAQSAQAPFSNLAQRIGEFLAFKQLAVPDGARWDAVISDPMQLLTPWCLDGRRFGGLRCSVAPWASWAVTAEPPCPCLWGGINLGEEPTSLVVINLPLAKLAAECRRRFPERPTPATAGELAERFLSDCPDYAPVRLLLGAGEGVRLPRGGMILAGYPGGKAEPEMVLLISRGTN
ncbi:MAG: hypothetical protein JNM56_25940 [Planctomycetia bacterium]|nr:hypothetical protein [Planctomycetia bacterium]